MAEEDFARTKEATETRRVLIGLICLMVVAGLIVLGTVLIAGGVSE